MNEQQNQPATEKKAAVFSEELFLAGVNTPVCVQLLINEPEFTLGKADRCQGVLTFSSEISREHCRITWREGRYYIEDLNSTNGTYLNGRLLRPGRQYRVVPGDQVRLSASTFVLEPIYSLYKPEPEDAKEE